MRTKNFFGWETYIFWKILKNFRKKHVPIKKKVLYDKTSKNTASQLKKTNLNLTSVQPDVSQKPSPSSSHEIQLLIYHVFLIVIFKYRIYHQLWNHTRWRYIDNVKYRYLFISHVPALSKVPKFSSKLGRKLNLSNFPSFHYYWLLSKS